MTNYNKNKQDLEKLAQHVKDPLFSEKLIQAYMKDTGFARKSITEREISAPVRIIDSFGRENKFIKNFSVINRKPIGKVAILLPVNGINILVAKAVGASYLIGNETIVKFPRRLKNSAPIFGELISKNLKNVSFADINISSKDFLLSCLMNPAIKAILIYGDDKWIEGYKNLARRTRTKIIFEGPGNDPQIVFESAQLDQAVEDAVECGLMNGGQSCSAIERFFVHENIVDVFTEKLCLRLKRVKIGLPNDPESDLTPVKSETIQKRLVSQIEEATHLGAKLVFGGEFRKINFSEEVMEPAVLTNCTPDMNIVKHENFGAVFPIISFNSEEGLIDMLDQTSYGLNASAYGNCSENVKDYLETTHRNIYYNSTVTSIENSLSRILDGGFKNSGFVWEWSSGNYIHREGKRYLVQELSQDENN